MASWSEIAERLFTHGIDAYAETQQVKYQANSPTSNQRGYNDVTAPTGQPALDTLSATLGNPMNLVLLGVAGVLVFVLVKRL